MESVLAALQEMILCGIVSWIMISSYLNVTQKMRSLLQRWVNHHVVIDTPFILQIQKYKHKYLAALLSGLSCVVSVPFLHCFFTFALLEWTREIGKADDSLMALCDFSGNVIKDVISASRPSTPPVRQVTATKDEKENALEYGLPSSHTFNTVSLSGYLLHYLL